MSLQTWAAGTRSFHSNRNYGNPIVATVTVKADSNLSHRSIMYNVQYERSVQQAVVNCPSLNVNCKTQNYESAFLSSFFNVYFCWKSTKFVYCTPRVATIHVDAYLFRLCVLYWCARCFVCTNIIYFCIILSCLKVMAVIWKRKLKFIVTSPSFTNKSLYWLYRMWRSIS